MCKNQKYFSPVANKQVCIRKKNNFTVDRDHNYKKKETRVVTTPADILVDI